MKKIILLICILVFSITSFSNEGSFSDVKGKKLSESEEKQVKGELVPQLIGGGIGAISSAATEATCQIIKYGKITDKKAIAMEAGSGFVIGALTCGTGTVVKQTKNSMKVALATKEMLHVAKVSSAVTVTKTVINEASKKKSSSSSKSSSKKKSSSSSKSSSKKKRSWWKLW